MKHRMRALLASTIFVGLVATPGVAFASTTEIIADTGGATLTMNVPGTPVDIVVTLDNVGDITSVAVGGESAFADDPATTDTVETATKVKFTPAAGTTLVEVKAKKDKLKTEVKSMTLADLEGSHQWNGMLFKDQFPVSVAFQVGSDPDGNPTLTVEDPVVDPSVEWTKDPVSTESHDGESQAKVRIDFMWNGYHMQLKIEVEVYDPTMGDDDSPSHSEYPAKLKVELKGKDRQQFKDVELATLVGSHVWTGRDCDGNDAYSVTYTISDTGMLTIDTVMANGVDVTAIAVKTDDDNGSHDGDHKTKIRFPDSKASVELKLDESDNGWNFSVKSKTTEKCKDDDSSSHDDDSSHDDGHSGKNKSDDDHGKKDGRHDDDD